MKDPRYATPSEVLAIRLAADLSQKEAAELVGIHEVSWQRWERGDVKKIRRAMLQPVVLAAKKAKR